MTKVPLGELELEIILLIVEKKVQTEYLTDAKGIPLSVTVEGANHHDKKLVKKTLDTITIDRSSR